MARREIPLFLFDVNREHKLGECDFVSCTDVENGFVAKIDYVSESKGEVTDTKRITSPTNGVQLRMEIKRITGTNPKGSSIRSLMKKAEELYLENMQREVNVEKITDKDIKAFLDGLYQSYKGELINAGVDVEKRNMAAMCLQIVSVIKDKINIP